MMKNTFSNPYWKNNVQPLSGLFLGKITFIELLIGIPLRG